MLVIQPAKVGFDMYPRAGNSGIFRRIQRGARGEKRFLKITARNSQYSAGLFDQGIRGSPMNCRELIFIAIARVASRLRGLDRVIQIPVELRAE